MKKQRPAESPDWHSTPIPVRRCVRHSKRLSTGYSKFGKARGQHLCDDCHNAVLAVKDEAFLKALEESEARAEAVIAGILKGVQ